MKKLSMLVSGLLLCSAVYAQDVTLPSTQIKELKTGKKVAFNATMEPGKVTVINFWATWCGPCKKEIKMIRKNLEAWHKEADFNYMTVSIDESKAEIDARSFGISQGWDFPFYIDPNGDLKRSLNFQNVPFSIIVDKNGKVVYTHSGYKDGDENELWAKVKELAGTTPAQAVPATQTGTPGQ